MNRRSFFRASGLPAVAIAASAAAAIAPRNRPPRGRVGLVKAGESLFASQVRVIDAMTGAPYDRVAWLDDRTNEIAIWTADYVIPVIAHARDIDVDVPGRLVRVLF